VGKSNGVFISGSAPAWVFAQRGYARLYPMKLDTFVRAFAEFHNANCPHGFIYFNHEVPIYCYCYCYSSYYVIAIIYYY
jgi:cleavage and polyadenylation specificity factor subunit 1